MFENKKMLILGFARSGYEAAKYLINRGNEVIVNDGGSKERQDSNKILELEELGVKFIFGEHPDDLLDSSFDYLIKNPGVPIDHKYVLKAKELGIEVLNEVEVAFRLLPSSVKLIGITGTNGKTTTTTLTYNIMKEAYGDRVHLCGNIGYPIIGILDKLKDEDIIVMEVSCQQGENFSTFRPDVGAFTNLSPAHIDFMKSYEHYREVKEKMFNNQSSDDIAIINYEDELLMNDLKDIKSNKKYFSSKREIDGCYVKDEAIYYGDNKIIDFSSIKIKGMHNVENIMASIMVSKEFNVSDEIIRKVISEFRGVEHRLEYVDTIDGVDYYNDTEATNIKSTQIALSSFKNPTIIFLGGLDRGQDFNELNDYIGNVKCVLGIGTCRDRVLEWAKSKNIEVYSDEFLKDSFKRVKDIAKSGDVVLLSPASASWDQYKECEIRGAEFKDLVKNLKN